jgi:hypothetical protein
MVRSRRSAPPMTASHGVRSRDMRAVILHE